MEQRILLSRHGIVIKNFRCAEIKYLDVAGCIEHHIFWFDVAMDYAKSMKPMEAKQLIVNLFQGRVQDSHSQSLTISAVQKIESSGSMLLLGLA